MGVRPKASDCFLGHVVVLESSPVEVEDGKLVLGHDIGARIEIDTGPYVCDSTLEVGGDGGIKLSLGIPCDINGTLIVEDPDSVHGGVGIGSHVEVVVVGKGVRCV